MNQSKSIDQALTEAFQNAVRLEAPLDERLKLYLGESRALLPELEATPGSQVPAMGEVLPDFCMTDSDGRLIELASLLETGPLVISFNRGPWCDYCGLELRALARAYPDRCGRRRRARALQATRSLPFRVLTDLDLGCALSLGLAFWVGEKIMGMYKGFGIDLAHFQGNGGWLLPIPATLVVGTDGHVKARFVDPDFRHRMRMEDILQAVKEDAGTWASPPRALAPGQSPHRKSFMYRQPMVAL